MQNDGDKLIIPNLEDDDIIDTGKPSDVDNTDETPEKLEARLAAEKAEQERLEKERDKAKNGKGSEGIEEEEEDEEKEENKNKGGNGDDDDDDEENGKKKDEDDDNVLIEAVSKSVEEELGIELTDEEGKPIKFDNSPEGVAELVKEAAPKLLEKFWVNNPDIYRFALHKKAGGTVDTFIKAEQAIPDKISLEIDDKTPEQQLESSYRYYLQLKGTDESEIDDLIALAKDKGKLKEKAEFAKKAVNDYADKVIAKRTKDLEEANAAAEKETKELWQNITKTVSSGKIGGMELSKTEQKELLDFVSKPVDKSGKTASDLATESLSIEQELLIELIKMKKFQGFKFSEQMKKDLSKKTLDELAKKNNERKDRTSGGKSGAESGKGDNGKAAPRSTPLIDNSVLDLL